MQPGNSSVHYAKRLKEIGMDLNLLIVEDDSILQQQFSIFLSRFFKTVDTANNGIEGWLKYEDTKYDIIITDITMPVMNGIEFATKIRMSNETQNILVMSAHSDSDKLIELINIGIDGFLLKPLNLDNALRQLIKTSQVVYDRKILDFFSTMLEGDNKDLRKNNIELESALDMIMKTGIYENTQATTNNTPEDIVQLPVEEYKESNNGYKINDDEKILFYVPGEIMSAVAFHNHYPFELDKTNEKMEMLEDSFNLFLVSSEIHRDHGTLKSLTKIIREYAHEIEMIPQFGAIGYGVRELAVTFDAVTDPEKLNTIMPMITSLFDNLENWRKSIFLNRDTDDIHYLDTSLMSDALSLRGILNNDNMVSDTDIELF